MVRSKPSVAATLTATSDTVVIQAKLPIGIGNVADEAGRAEGVAAAKESSRARERAGARGAPINLGTIEGVVKRSVE